jgi:hypothetical protein
MDCHWLQRRKNQEVQRSLQTHSEEEGQYSVKSHFGRIDLPPSKGLKKKSNATKANIDPTEKVLKKLSFKVLDLVKPLLFLAGRSRLKRKSKSDSMAIRIALRLWATLFRDIIKSRRNNILSQVYPEYLGLLDRDDIWSGGEDLFGKGFLKHLVEEAKSQAALEGIPKIKSTPSKDKQAASTSQRRSTNHFNSVPREGYVTVSPISFGGQISLYVKV